VESEAEGKANGIWGPIRNGGEINKKRNWLTKMLTEKHSVDGMAVLVGMENDDAGGTKPISGKGAKGGVDGMCENSL
jgi:hypothetical protein